MTRQVWVVFFGNFRGYQPRVATHPSEPKAVEHPQADHADPHGAELAGEHEHGSHDPHESPWTMTLPLIILAIFAVLAGFVNTPFYHGLSSFLLPGEAGAFDPTVMIIAIIVALAGIGFGWALYRNAFATAADLDPLERMMPGVFRLLNRKFYFDELYANTFGKLSYALAWAWNLLDRYVIDGLIRLTAAITVFFGRLNFIIDDTVLNDGADALSDGTYNTGDTVRQVETGKIQDYVSLIFAGVVVLGLIYLYSIRK
jgi:NADH-quinone oxidoreductase subunit L